MAGSDPCPEGPPGGAALWRGAAPTPFSNATERRSVLNAKASSGEAPRSHRHAGSPRRGPPANNTTATPPGGVLWAFPLVGWAAVAAVGGADWCRRMLLPRPRGPPSTSSSTKEILNAALEWRRPGYLRQELVHGAPAREKAAGCVPKALKQHRGFRCQERWAFGKQRGCRDHGRTTRTKTTTVIGCKPEQAGIRPSRPRCWRKWTGIPHHRNVDRGSAGVSTCAAPRPRSRGSTEMMVTPWPACRGGGLERKKKPPPAPEAQHSRPTPPTRLRTTPAKGPRPRPPQPAQVTAPSAGSRQKPASPAPAKPPAVFQSGLRRWVQKRCLNPEWRPPTPWWMARLVGGGKSLIQLPFAAGDAAGEGGVQGRASTKAKARSHTKSKRHAGPGGGVARRGGGGTRHPPPQEARPPLAPPRCARAH